MRKFLHYTLAFLLYSSIVSAQIPQTGLKDILEFKIDSTRHKIAGWFISSSVGNVRSGIARDSLKKGKDIIFFASSGVRGVRGEREDREESECSMSTGFLLPDVGNSHSMEASFLCKNQGYDTIRIIFTGFDTYGNIISTDTLETGKTSDWCESTQTIKIKNVSYMHLNLGVKGNASDTDKIVWIYRIRLKVDGRDLTEYPFPDWKRDYIPDIDGLVKLSFDNSFAYKQIPLLATKKIVALGESLHGSGTLEESAIQIMKHRVLYNNCRLILLELPLEKVLSINRYVLGDERFELDSITKNLDFCLYSENLLDFIVWLRKYNQNAHRKVLFLGIDAPSTTMLAFETHLFEYFYHMNKNRMNDSIKEFLRLILTDSRTAMGPVFSSLKNDVDFKKNMDPLEVEVIENCWNNWLKVPDYNSMFVARDSIMYSNVKFMTNLLCDSSETVTIYSHLEHACYDKTHTLNNYPRNSYGSLLKNDFGDNYSTIGLIAYQGEVLSLPNKKQIKATRSKLNFYKQAISPIQSNSLEHLLHKSNFDYLYTPVAILPNTQLYIRMVTNAKQFVNLIHPRHFMDGVIYVRESESMHPFRGDISISEKYEDLIKRFQRYETLFKE